VRRAPCIEALLQNELRGAPVIAVAAQTAAARHDGGGVAVAEIHVLIRPYTFTLYKRT
jgi:hypothetical protein